MSRGWRGAVCGFVGAALLHAGSTVAQPAAPATAASAQQLSKLLAAPGQAAGPRFIAAEDPADASRFMAAMLLPDLQLLVVSAAYKVPVLLRERVLTRKYREAYQDLQAASIPDSRVTIEDLLANGLAFRPVKGQPADAITRGDVTVRFDGQWRKSKMSETEYRSAFEKAEKEYARLLGLLITQAKRP